MKVWYNGFIKDIEDVKISLFCHALHYGSSVFEGIRAYELDDGSVGIFRLKDHIRRFFYSASKLKMNILFSKEEIYKACIDVVKVNNLKNCYIRPLAFYNKGKLGLDVRDNTISVAIMAFEFPEYLGTEPISIKISSYRRISPLICDPHAKIGGYYVNSILSTLEAKEEGYDEALLLDLNGNVAEGPGENIFFIKGDKLITPKEDSILPGITRDTILTIAEDLGYKTEIRNVHVSELETFDEAFFVGTAAEVVPIKKINKIYYETKRSFEIRSYYLDVVKGRVNKYNFWITKI